MLAAGRVTAEEAARVNAAEDGPEVEAALVAIRRRHATERVQAELAAGRLDKREADSFLERLAAGEDPETLRGLLPRRRAPTADADS